tara:strand:+ start:239 stop:1066 length:828 start_codon:yes stop_codon:yes gene_type:complete
MFFYNLKIFFLRLIGYEKPLRVAFLKLLSLKYKTFRPQYETILLESCKEAKKIGYNEISVLELGVAGGNGMVSLENYKKKIEKILDIKINIYGFDTGEGLPVSKLKEDLPFVLKKGQFKIDKEQLERKINSKIFYGDIKDTIEEFCNLSPKNISVIFFDLDFYSSTASFLKKINIWGKFISPRVYCYFDDLFYYNYISEFNGELLAIKEFNKENQDFKIGTNIDHVADFKFPLGKGLLYTLHNFNHEDYLKYIGFDDTDLMALDNNKISYKLFKN